MFLSCLRFLFTHSHILFLLLENSKSSKLKRGQLGMEYSCLIQLSFETIYFREFKNLGREREVERIGPGKSKTQVRTVNSFTPIGLFFPSSTPARINKNMCF